MADSSFHVPATAAIRALTWNVAFGHGTAAAVALADEFSVDVMMLQEALPPDLWLGPSVGAQVADRSWGSWVLVRTGTLDPVEIAGYSGWVAGARWQRTGEADLYLFSVHSPTASRTERRGSYVAESRAIVRAVSTGVPQTAPLVIGGDFNFKSLGHRLPSESIPNDRAESQALLEFRSLGLSVAWQGCHPGEPLPQTLRWRRDPAAPFHCDGFLVRGLRPTRCEVLQPVSDPCESDHNAVLLEWGAASAELEESR